MARTHDPSAATRKAWLTRARAANGGGGATQQRADFATPELRKAQAGWAKSLVKLSDGSAGHGFQAMEDLPYEMAALIKPLSLSEKTVLQKTEAAVRHGLKALDVPEIATDGLAGVVVATRREVSAALLADPLGNDVAGFYRPGAKRIWINSDPVGWSPSARITAAHELGHHAHMNKMTDGARVQWSSLSRGGAGCRLSSYGRENEDEHFAEAFAAYARGDGAAGGLNRRRLRALEPETYAFMDRLWKDPRMWRYRGETRT